MTDEEMKDESQEKDDKIHSRDLDYISDAKSALIDEAPKKVRLGILLMFLVLAFGVTWAHFAEIDEVIKANGKIIPTQQLQVVQNLEGGIVKDIKVDEDQHVKAGQVVLTLDATRWESEYRRDLAKAAVLEAEIARLEAEAGLTKEPIFSTDLKQRYPKVVDDAMKHYQARQDALKEKLDTLQKSYDLTKEELGIITPLAKEGVMSRIDYLRLEKQIAAIEGEINEATEQARKEANDRLNVVRADKKLLDESIIAGQDRMQRTELRSPVTGIVNQIYVSSKGEVIRPGQRVLDIVPGDSLLTIQARVKPDDIGFIKKGQHAVVKVTAYNFARYGGLDAKVSSISADSLADDSGNLYYEVKLIADKMYVGTDDRKLEITPGMTVSANITVGKKSVLEYMLKPFLKARYDAFSEG